MNLSTVPPCARAIVDISVKYSLRSAVISSGCSRSVVAGEVLDVGEEDRELLALGRDRDVLLAAEDALVDLRREILGELHRDRGEEVVGWVSSLFMPRISPAWRHCQDEGEAGSGGEHEIAEELLEGEDVGADRLRDRDLLDAAHIADLPVLLRAVGMGVVAADAGLAHDAPGVAIRTWRSRSEPDTSAIGCAGSARRAAEARLSNGVERVRARAR